MTTLVDTPLETRGVTRYRVAVPWLTVLPLAVVLAYADGFWLMSLREAIGAAGRTPDPFTSWWRESTVLLPVFVFAVLAAVTLALRWFGPVLRNRRAVVLTVLLIAAAGTLAGLAATVASSAYDYHLQVAQLPKMNAMRGVCGPGCLDAQERLTLAVHVRGVVYISRWLLLTNLVLVAWIVAMMGGRLRTSAHREQPTDSPDQRTTSGSRAADLRLVLAAGLVGSAAIHAAVVPEHLTEWSAAGLFFVGLTAAELAVAGLLLAGPPRRSVLVSAAVVSIGPLLIWLASRTAGLPFGPEPGVPEAIGLPDTLACALEIVTLGAAAALLRGGGRSASRPPLTPHVKALVMLALIAVTAIGTTATGLTGLDAFGLSGGHAVMDMSH